MTGLELAALAIAVLQMLAAAGARMAARTAEEVAAADAATNAAWNELESRVAPFMPSVRDRLARHRAGEAGVYADTGKPKLET